MPRATPPPARVLCAPSGPADSVSHHPPPLRAHTHTHSHSHARTRTRARLSWPDWSWLFPLSAPASSEDRYDDDDDDGRRRLPPSLPCEIVRRVACEATKTPTRTGQRGSARALRCPVLHDTRAPCPRTCRRGPYIPRLHGTTVLGLVVAAARKLASGLASGLAFPPASACRASLRTF